MKGFIIFEDFKKLINCEEILDGDYNCVISDYPNGTFGGIVNRVTGATCAKEDTYDFEVGALIALMKMCGFDKSYKAIEEAFKYNSYDTKKTKELEEEIKKLKKRINELEVYNNQLEDRVAAEQRGGYMFLKDMEKLQHEYDLCKNSENALKCSVDYLNKTIAKLNVAIAGYKEDLNKATKRCEELEIKESTLNKQQEQLDKREEKISVYFGGRGNGKQYKALVELFKKLPKDKVQAAYVTAYKESLIWCTSQPSIRDQLDSLLESSKYAIPTVDKWLYKIPTKREKMWNDILTCGDCEHSKYVKVKREDLETFAKECNEKKIFSIIGCEIKPQTYWSDDNSYIFQIFRKPAGFICAKMVVFVYKDTIVDYLPPMRWDLFKKGRLVVGVRKEHYEEFKEEINRQFGIINIHKPYDDFNYSYFIFDKNANFIEVIGRSQFRQLKEINKRKVVYWEDVR